MIKRRTMLETTKLFPAPKNILYIKIKNIFRLLNVTDNSGAVKVQCIGFVKRIMHNSLKYKKH